MGTSTSSSSHQDDASSTTTATASSATTNSAPPNTATTTIRSFRMTVALLLAVIQVLLVVLWQSTTPQATMATTTAIKNKLTDDASPLEKSQSQLYDHADSVATIGNVTVTYRFAPRRLEQFRQDDKDDAPTVLVGVLSQAKNWRQRDLIRQTWALNSGSSVYFVVSSMPNVTNRAVYLQQELEHYGDLIWLTNLPETYRGLVYKTITLFHAVSHHLPPDSYRHVFKTDDDSYVRLGQVEHLSATVHKSSDYWGKCSINAKVNRLPRHKWYVSEEDYAPNTFPPYAMGAGYGLSPTLAKVAAALAARRPAVVPVEDANTGLLASLVDVPCRHEASIYAAAPYQGHPQPDAPHWGTNFSVKYNTLPTSMLGYHYLTCSMQQQQQLQRIRQQQRHVERKDLDDVFVWEKSCGSRSPTIMRIGEGDDDGINNGEDNFDMVALPLVRTEATP